MDQIETPITTTEIAPVVVTTDKCTYALVTVENKEVVRCTFEYSDGSTFTTDYTDVFTEDGVTVDEAKIRAKVSGPNGEEQKMIIVAA